MSFETENLDLIDLLSERHTQLRKMVEKKWNDNSNIQLANSEWYIMARIYKKQPTIAYVSRNVDITRQATHKFIKNLETKGLVEISDAKHNKKDKRIKLTELGEACYEKNETLKADLEKKIAEQIGEEQMKLLKEILTEDWGL